jgi:hypothetical protein
MKTDPTLRGSVADFLGCFGQYRQGHPVCRQQCILSLRCAIEQDQNSRIEVIEDLLSLENAPSRLQ